MDVVRRLILIFNDEIYIIYLILKLTGYRVCSRLYEKFEDCWSLMWDNVTKDKSFSNNGV